MKLSEITIQADHPTIPYVTHLRLRCNLISLHLVWGFFYAGRFCWTTDEFISLEENPELVALNDGSAWNVEEIKDLVAGSVAQFPDQPPTPALSTH